MVHQVADILHRDFQGAEQKVYTEDFHNRNCRSQSHDQYKRAFIRADIIAIAPTDSEQLYSLQEARLHQGGVWPIMPCGHTVTPQERGWSRNIEIFIQLE